MQDNKHDPYNLAIVVCYTSKDYIVLEKSQPRFKQQLPSKMLVIDRKSNKISVQSSFNTSNFIKRTFSAFLGVTTLEGQKFAVFCDEAKVACSVPKFPIFQISSLFFLSFTDEKEIKKLQQRKQIFCKIRDLNILLERGFYFSPDYNITRTLEYQKLDFVMHYTWNKKFIADVSHIPAWITPIIQGYVSFFQIFLQGTKIYYILISRRSVHKGGTRYFDRGLNQKGYVANYVETEQIVQINEYLISDVQIRGTLPLFFQQKGLTTKIKLTRGYELTHQIFEKHLSKIIREYERIFWVNLLSVKKTGEAILIKQIQKHIKDYDEKQLKYMYFDFHTHASGGKYDNVDVGVEKVANIKKNLKFYIYDSKKDQVLMRQQGTFRTNCLDCLDRTNFFQTRLAMITLQEILASFQIHFQKPLIKMMSDPYEQSYEIVNFRNIWANNGDQISYHYTGTGSTHTDIIRDGQRGFLGGFKQKYKSVSRFYNQNFWDFYKMKLVDQLLGKNVSQFQTSKIPAMIEQRQLEFCEKQIVDIYLFTWKPPKKIPPSLNLFPNNSDIIVVSLQEISEEERWKCLVNQAIDSYQYILVSQKCSIKNLLMVFAKKSLSHIISKVQLTKVKFKSMYNTYLSSKCAVIIRFYVHSTRMTFIGAQLEYGRQNASNRIENLKDIHKYAFQEQVVGQKTSQDINEDHVIFLLGNLNTNIASSEKQKISKFSEVANLNNLNLQQRRLVTQLIEKDQFSDIQERLLHYRYYEEQDVKFPPSYKYIKSKKSFDPEVSGWPDRIWYSTDKKIICSRYGIIEEMRDEHAPVFANYQVQVDSVDEEKRLQVSEQIFVRISDNKGYLDDIEQQFPEVEMRKAESQQI